METVSLFGTFKFESAENVNEYLRGLGVGLVLRKMLSVARPSCTISYNTDTEQWVVVFESLFSRKESTFCIGEKFEDETFDGRKCWSTVEILDDDKTVMNWLQTCEEGPDVSTVIQATNMGLQITHKSGELICVLKFLRGQEPAQILPTAPPP